MAIQRTLISFMYFKTRRKCLAVLFVILCFIALLILSVHRKEKNQALWTATNLHPHTNNIVDNTNNINSNIFYNNNNDNNNNPNREKFNGNSNFLSSNNNNQHAGQPEGHNDRIENKYKQPSYVNSNVFNSKEYYDSGRASKVDYYINSTKPPDKNTVLVFTDLEKSKAKDRLKFVFKSFNINFDCITWNRLDDNYLTMPRLTDKHNNNRYVAIIFTNEVIYDNIDSFSLHILRDYCAQFNIGIIILTYAAGPYGRIYPYTFSTLPLTIVNDVSDAEDLSVPNISPNMLKLVKSGKTWSGELPGNHHVIFSSGHSTFIPVAVTNVPQKERNMPVILYDKGLYDGIRKVLFGVDFWDLWLYQLFLVDALTYVSNAKIGYGLERFIQIDIDDVFVGKPGRRLIKKDVEELIKAQKYFSDKIRDFKFNLGYSSGHFKRSVDTLDVEGDEYLIRQHVSKHFRWFDHTARHLKPHQYTEDVLIADFENNKRFAKKHELPVDHTYSVAPHHSGVYPVHDALYSAWKKVFGIQVTSTESYPHLYPAHGRRGFTYKNVMVLPRQTCGLFTKTVSEANHPKGPTYLYDLTQGGELFWTIVFNPISIFMTHACNYGMKERLAIALFKNVTNFIEEWTHIQLRSAPPVELAKKYFELFPKQLEPLWTDPCTDLRHQKIWNHTKKYCDVDHRSNIARLPDVLIVGPQKTGTTALLTFLGLHPEVVRSRKSNRSFEEIQFFNRNNYKKGLNWYLDFFPDEVDKDRKLYIDKSANYFDSLKAPHRASSILPNVKIIIISTDPRLRAYSWYQHMLSKNDPIAKTHSFYEVITGRNKTSDIRFWLLHTKCLLPGRYAEALQRWLQYYNSSQIIIVDGDELRRKPVVVLQKVQSFLDLSYFSFGKHIRYNVEKRFYCLYSDGKYRCLGKGKGRHYEQMTSEESKFLTSYYHLPNLQFSDLLRKYHKPLPKWLQIALKST